MRLMLIEGIAALDSVDAVMKEWPRVLDTISNEWTSYQNSRTNDSMRKNENNKLECGADEGRQRHEAGILLIYMIIESMKSANLGRSRHETWPYSKSFPS